ncbi:MAG: PAS domain-containing sensor histidine kinase, partial [Deltaproteobacteria bacterium]|nr:PAS domain-containing sensor histidine kinase [Deltaproteobacteria bacterium]
MANDLLDNLNRLLASLVCGRLVLDPQGMVLQSDVAAGQILGQGEAGLKGRGFDSLFTAWDQSPGVFSSLDKSGVTAIPLAAIRADGSNLAISMTISPSPEEMPPGYTCLFTDLDTFMRHMAMEEGHQINYRHIFEQHPLPCLMLDGELRISDVNRAFAGLFKESLADLDPPVRKGQQPLSVPALKRLLNLAEPAGEPATPGKPALEDCLENHAAGQWEVPKSGTGPEAYTLSLLALKDLAGMHSGFLISRLPGSEPARQGGMQQGGYHEYLGRLGHELRTPLNAVLGYLRLAEECEGPPGLESLNHVRNARIAARNLLELINNLLELARLESGRVNLQTGELDIRELAEEVTHAMAAMAFSRNLEIGCHVHPDIPLKINAAPMALRQILYNLLSNGIKYTDQGGVWLRISQPEGAAPGLKIEVGDTGRGIDPADQEKIFESFVRASRQEDDDAGSAGLGLAIIRHLVDLLQGKIELESRPGQGSLFSVILPAEQQGRQPQPPPQP